MRCILLLKWYMLMLHSVSIISLSEKVVTGVISKSSCTAPDENFIAPPLATLDFRHQSRH